MATRPMLALALALRSALAAAEAPPPSCTIAARRAAAVEMGPSPGGIVTDEAGRVWATECALMGDCKLTALDADFHVRWSRPFDGRRAPRWVRAYLDGGRVLVQVSTLLLAFGADDGKPLWTHDLVADLPSGSDHPFAGTDGRTRVIALGDNLVAAVSASTGAGANATWLVALGAADGTRRWLARFSGVPSGMVATGGKLWLGLAQGPGVGEPIAVVAVDARGVERHRAPLRDPHLPRDLATLLFLGVQPILDERIVVTLLQQREGAQCPPGAPCRPPVPMTELVARPRVGATWSRTTASQARPHAILVAGGVLWWNRHALVVTTIDGHDAPLCELLAIGSVEPLTVVDGALLAVLVPNRSGPDGDPPFIARLPLPVRGISRGMPVADGGDGAHHQTLVP